MTRDEPAERKTPTPAIKPDICLKEELLRNWDSLMPPDPLLDGIRHLLEDKK